LSKELSSSSLPLTFCLLSSNLSRKVSIKLVAPELVLERPALALELEEGTLPRQTEVDGGGSAGCIEDDRGGGGGGGGGCCGDDDDFCCCGCCFFGDI